jgi:hypothetical protein
MAVSASFLRLAGHVEAFDDLSEFREVFYDCLRARRDALFELTDALLCAEGPVISLPELSLTGVHRRGHGAMYDALAHGSIAIARFRMALAGLELPRSADRQLSIAIDVTAWPRPDAECSPARLHCHRPCRCDAARQTIPGWPYSVAAALGGGRTSWTAPLDICRIGPHDDLTDFTAGQIRDLVKRLTAAGQLRPDDPPPLVILDSGYDIVRLTWLLRHEPVRLLGRIRADRVMYGPPGRRRGPRPGRQPRHGAEFRLAEAATHPDPAQESASTHPRFGPVLARCWGHLHPKLERRNSWADHDADLPIVEGTLIHLSVDHLPGDRDPKPLWLWHSHPQADTVELDRLWRIFLRRFDLEHTFRFFKQTLGLTRPRLRLPEQADRWAWLIIAAYTQLRLARLLTHDLRRPWEKPLDPEYLTPGRVRRGYRRLHPILGTPASAPKPSHPGPGRPKGRTSTPAPRYPVGKKHQKKDTPRRGSTPRKG